MQAQSEEARRTLQMSGGKRARVALLFALPCDGFTSRQDTRRCTHRRWREYEYLQQRIRREPVTSVVCFDELLDIGVLTVQACNVAGIDGHLITPQHLREHITAMSLQAHAGTLCNGTLPGAFLQPQYRLCGLVALTAEIGEQCDSCVFITCTSRRRTSLAIKLAIKLAIIRAHKVPFWSGPA